MTDFRMLPLFTEKREAGGLYAGMCRLAAGAGLGTVGGWFRFAPGNSAQGSLLGNPVGLNPGVSLLANSTTPGFKSTLGLHEGQQKARVLLLFPAG